METGTAMHKPLRVSVSRSMSSRHLEEEVTVHLRHHCYVGLFLTLPGRLLIPRDLGLCGCGMEGELRALYQFSVIGPFCILVNMWPVLKNTFSMHKIKYTKKISSYVW